MMSVRSDSSVHSGLCFPLVNILLSTINSFIAFSVKLSVRFVDAHMTPCEHHFHPTFEYTAKHSRSDTNCYTVIFEYSQWVSNNNFRKWRKSNYDSRDGYAIVHKSQVSVTYRNTKHTVYTLQYASHYSFKYVTTESRWLDSECKHIVSPILLNSTKKKKRETMRLVENA